MRACFLFFPSGLVLLLVTLHEVHGDSAYCTKTVPCTADEEKQEYEQLLDNFGLSNDPAFAEAMEEQKLTSIAHLSRVEPDDFKNGRVRVPTLNKEDFEHMLRYIGAKGFQAFKWRPGERDPSRCEHCGKRENSHFFRDRFCRYE